MCQMEGHSLQNRWKQKEKKSFQMLHGYHALFVSVCYLGFETRWTTEMSMGAFKAAMGMYLI